MTNFFDLSSTAKRFRFVAVLEAFTWLGLLIGMAFKYIPADGNEIGVKIFGPIHGGVFVVYLAVAVLTAVKLKWDIKATLLALVAAFPPVRHRDLRDLGRAHRPSRRVEYRQARSRCQGSVLTDLHRPPVDDASR